MAKARLHWLRDQQYIGVDSTRHGIVISTPDGANGVGVKPVDLLLLALAGCTAVDVVTILQKQRAELADLEIEVEGEQDPDPPWAFRKIHMHFRVRGKGLEEARVARAIRLSEEKYCAVAASLRPRVAIETSFDLQAL